MAFSRIPNRWLGIGETLQHAPQACQHSVWQPLGRPECAGSKSDGFVLLEHVGDVGTNDMIGGESDLLRNWNDLLDAAGLTPEERTEAEGAYQSHVHSFRVA